MEDKRIKLLRDEPIKKAVRALSIPAIIGLVVLAIYNVVDTMFVAWLGTSATGATQVVLPITMLVSAFGLAFGMGGGSYISRLLGSDNRLKANKVASVSLWSSISLGIIFTIASIIFLEPLLRFFGASDGVMQMSKDYGLYILLASVFFMGNMTLNNMLRAEGSAKLSMIGMGVGAILNIILDPILIFVFDLGISGAAIATSFSQIVTFTILMSRYLRHHSVAKINFKYFKPSREIYYEIFKVGVPTFLRQVLFSISLGILNTGAITYGGDDLLAAIGLIFKVSMIPMYIIFGIGQGFQPVIGYNFGSKNKKRVMDTFKYGLKLSLIVGVVASILILIFPNSILAIFKASDSVKAYGITGLRYYALAFIFMPISNTVGVFYQAIGKGKESLFLSVARQGMFFIPAVYILPKYFSTNGILGAQLLGDILTLVLSTIMFYIYIKSNKLDRDMG